MRGTSTRENSVVQRSTTNIDSHRVLSRNCIYLLFFIDIYNSIYTIQLVKPIIINFKKFVLMKEWNIKVMIFLFFKYIFLISTPPHIWYTGVRLYRYNYSYSSQSEKIMIHSVGPQRNKF